MTTLPFGEVAPIQRRVVAYILDTLIASAIPIVGTIIAVSMLVGAASSSDPASTVVTVTFVALPVIMLLQLAWLIVYTLMQAGAGSIGMRAQRLRLVSARTGERIGFWRAFLRNVVFLLTASIVVGYFSPLFDGSGRFQGWHDKVVDAVMLDDRAAAPAAATTPATAALSAPPMPVPDAPPLPRPGAGFAAPPMPPMPPMPTVAPSAPLAGPPAPPAAPPSFGGPGPVGAADPAELPDETIVAPRRTEALPDDPLISFVPGVTQPPPAAPASEAPVAPVDSAAAAVPAAPAEPSDAAAPSSRAFGAPVAPSPAPAARGELDSTRISIPGHRLVFTWDDGQRATVSSRTVFGRNPEPEAGAVVVAVRDETLSLSKTHFEAEAEPTGGWIMDRQSTNGTVIVRDGVRIACPPGQRIPVRLGDAIEIGDRIVTIGGFA